MSLIAYVYLYVTGGSICGGLTRWAYPLMFDSMEPKIGLLKFKLVLFISTIIGILLSSYFYIGLANSKTSLSFIIQLAMVSFLLTFSNLDKLHKIKFNGNQ